MGVQDGREGSRVVEGRHWALRRKGQRRSTEGSTSRSPMKPWFGVAMSGGAISSVIPQTSVVLPIRISAEDGAVEMDPASEERSASLFGVPESCDSSGASSEPIKAYRGPKTRPTPLQRAPRSASSSSKRAFSLCTPPCPGCSSPIFTLASLHTASAASAPIGRPSGRTPSARKRSR